MSPRRAVIREVFRGRKKRSLFLITDTVRRVSPSRRKKDEGRKRFPRCPKPNLKAHLCLHHLHYTCTTPAYRLSRHHPAALRNRPRILFDTRFEKTRIDKTCIVQVCMSSRRHSDKSTTNHDEGTLTLRGRSRSPSGLPTISSSCRSRPIPSNLPARPPAQSA